MKKTKRKWISDWPEVPDILCALSMTNLSMEETLLFQDSVSDSKSTLYCLLVNCSLNQKYLKICFTITTCRRCKCTIEL